MSNNCWLWSFNTENEEKLTYFVIRSRKENMAYSKEKMLQSYTGAKVCALIIKNVYVDQFKDSNSCFSWIYLVFPCSLIL